MNSGYLYIVIFEQGTVKIGMTLGEPLLRRASHEASGSVWGIKLKKFISEQFPAPGINLRETALARYCAIAAGNIHSKEWFKFEDPGKAEIEVSAALDKVREGDLSCLKSVAYDEEEKVRRFNFAMSLMKNGMSANEAAAKLNMSVRSIVTRKKYKEWAKGSILIKEQSNG